MILNSVKTVLRPFRKLYRKFMHVIDIYRFRGDRYECPCCGYQTKDWLIAGSDFPILKEKDVIGARRYKKKCPKCGSIDRARLIYTYLFLELRIQETMIDSSILHIAPERAIYPRFVKENFTDYQTGDTDLKRYKHIKNTQYIDLTEMEADEGSYDLIVANHVLEHIPDDRTAMREIFRTLKPGAFAILQVPISQNSALTYEDSSILDREQRELHFGQYDHVRIYGQDFISRLESAGFEVDRINISSCYPKFGLHPDEDIFIARKPTR